MILEISGHPRGVGTARLLLEEALEEARGAGGETRVMAVPTITCLALIDCIQGASLCF